MMKKTSFADLPLSRKLSRVQAWAVGMALVITLLLNILTEIWEAQRSAQIDIETTGKMVSFNAGIALMFNDSKSATDILASLRNKPTIVVACLFRNEGLVLAQYSRDTDGVCKPEMLSKTIADEGLMSIFAMRKNMLLNVDQDGETVGRLLLVADLQPMWIALLNKFGLISLVMLVVFWVSAIFWRRLATPISAPLMDLAKIAQQMSREKNYSLRARGEGSDEVGRLVKSFNLMMEQIQERDDKLEKHSARLEQEVQSRTADLRHAVIEAQAASMAKSQFLANMSHEIRTPMNGVIGMVDVLFNTPLSNEQKKMVQVIRQSAYTQLGILNDILDFSKIEAGKMELSVGPFSVHDVISNICDLYDKQATEKNVKLLHTIDPLIPRVLEGDMLRLRQVLSNLITNAIKFTAGLSRSGVVNVDVRVAKKEGERVWVDFRIKDNGIGMTEGTMSRLFQSFEQGDISTTRRYTGTGLGLVISRRLTELMGGYIDVESKHDEGSVFCLHLPLKRVSTEVFPAMLRADWEHQPIDLAGISAAPSREQALTQKRLILVAEDNETNQDVVRQQLNLLGYAADVAADGREALALWLNSHYALVLTDIHMPYMDGYQLTEAIRQEEAKNNLARMPVIALTAVALKGEDERCRLAGMDDYLSKPAPLPAMKAVLEKWLPLDATRLPGGQDAGWSDKAIPESDAVDSLPVWDENALSSVVGNNQTMQRHLLEKFLGQADEKVAILCGAAESDDVTAVGDIAHAFKSAARTVGAMQLGELCYRLEQAGKAGDKTTCKVLSVRLEEHLRVVAETIKQKLSADH
ncbi:MAG: ATP-binding protein [Gammaproteobacteria bacterium]